MCVPEESGVWEGAVHWAGRGLLVFLLVLAESSDFEKSVHVLL